MLKLALTAPFGWSGETVDLREFATRAVLQHFPRSLARVPGVDFRVPTADELDALAAFMRSVFVPADQHFDVSRRVTTAAEQRGLTLFFGSGKCTFCHNGALLGGTGGHFDTGVVNAGASSAFASQRCASVWFVCAGIAPGVISSSNNSDGRKKTLNRCMMMTRESCCGECVTSPLRCQRKL